MMDAADRKLLNLLQTGLPLVPRPFMEIAAMAGLDEKETIARVKSLLSHGAQPPSAVIHTDVAQPPSAVIHTDVAQPPSAVIKKCRNRSSDRSAPQTPPLRKIGPILDSRALGYAGTLAAMAVPDNKIDGVAEIVNSFPGVTHNYIREAEGRTAPYNMWFTVHARDEAALREILREIEKRSGLKAAQFDATKMFKISALFELDESNED
jgi:DNA-binding Lrp family transcriptional regulator